MWVTGIDRESGLLLCALICVHKYISTTYTPEIVLAGALTRSRRDLIYGNRPKRVKVWNVIPGCGIMQRVSN